jgi:hypothetical protein
LKLAFLRCTAKARFVPLHVEGGGDQIGCSNLTTATYAVTWLTVPPRSPPRGGQNVTFEGLRNVHDSHFNLIFDLRLFGQSRPITILTCFGDAYLDVPRLCPRQGLQVVGPPKQCASIIHAQRVRCSERGVQHVSMETKNVRQHACNSVTNQTIHVTVLCPKSLAKLELHTRDCVV